MAPAFAELIRAGLQELIEVEASETLGVGRYERTGAPTTHRNGLVAVRTPCMAFQECRAWCFRYGNGCCAT